VPMSRGAMLLQRLGAVLGCCGLFIFRYTGCGTSLAWRSMNCRPAPRVSHQGGEADPRRPGSSKVTCRSLRLLGPWWSPRAAPGFILAQTL